MTCAVAHRVVLTLSCSPERLYAYTDPTLPQEFQLPGSGPIIKTCAGRQSTVRFRNMLQVPTSVHLHGAGSLAPYDGWADDRTFPGEFKVCVVSPWPLLCALTIVVAAAS